MSSISTVGFRKLRTCPHSDALLTFCLDSYGTTCVAEHVAACDFCGAELQLLSRFAQPANALPFAVLAMPAPLRLLAEEILSEPSFNRARFAESLLEIERMTLTDA
ncbi:MAG: hypothetical protein QOC61_592 [Acidobacteriota bacterium]|nr:hypothetical protein [Acidobacteriota bacterium]MDT5261588.1 hypothetical protein [Acidobacteriota bacterium]MDT7778668.1 hypothetical protein [Acidobacteriota bacterium]